MNGKKPEGAQKRYTTMETNFLLNRVKITHTKNVKGEPEREPIEVIEAVESIRKGVYFDHDLKQQCNRLAVLNATGQTDKYKAEKSNLPAFYWGCTAEGANATTVKSATGLAIFDFDHFGTDENPTDINVARNKLAKDPHTAILFYSPSGNGLKVVVKIPIITVPEGTDTNDPQAVKEALKATYKLYYFALVDYYKNSLGLTTDTSGQNINRACYFAYDPNIIYNPSAKEWEQAKQPEPTTQTVTTPTPTPKPTGTPAPMGAPVHDDYYYNVGNFEEFIKEMQLQGVHICDDYENWLKMLFAIHKEFGDTKGGYYADLISQINDKYNCNEFVKQWAKVCTADDGRTGIEFIFSTAKQNGLRVPESAKNKLVRQTPTAQETTPKTPEKAPQTKAQKQPKAQTPPPAELSDESAKEWNSTNPVKCAKIWIGEKYNVRYNGITRNFEYKEKRAQKWERLEDNFVSWVWEQLHTKYNVKISHSETNHLFQSYAKDNTYNPITDFINSLPDWNIDPANSPIDNYFSQLDNPTETDLLLCKKWFCQLVAIATQNNFRPQIALILQGSQGVKKTEFLRQLIPQELQDDHFLNTKLTSHEKDQQENLLKKWLIQIDEFEAIVRNEEKNANWKALVNHNSHIDFRAVGKTYHLEGKAYGIFCATTNRTDIYSDNENRRNFTMFLNTELDIHKIKSYDVLPMYAEAKAILKANPEFAYTTRDEEIYITNKAKALRAQTDEEMYFNEYFNVVCDPDTDEQTARFVLSTKQIYNIIDWLEYGETETHIVNKVKPVLLGRMLSQFAQKHSTGRANITYYIVYAHARYIEKVLQYCVNIGGQFKDENTYNKPYYHCKDSQTYKNWREEQQREQEQEQRQGKSISLFDPPTPTKTQNPDTTRTQHETPPDESADDFTPENILRQYNKGGVI